MSATQPFFDKMKNLDAHFETIRARVELTVSQTQAKGGDTGPELSPSPAIMLATVKNDLRRFINLEFSGEHDLAALLFEVDVVPGRYIQHLDSHINIFHVIVSFFTAGEEEFKGRASEIYAVTWGKDKTDVIRCGHEMDLSAKKDNTIVEKSKGPVPAAAREQIEQEEVEPESTVSTYKMMKEIEKIILGHTSWLRQEALAAATRALDPDKLKKKVEEKVEIVIQGIIERRVRVACGERGTQNEIDEAIKRAVAELKTARTSAPTEVEDSDEEEDLPPIKKKAKTKARSEPRSLPAALAEAAEALRNGFFYNIIPPECLTELTANPISQTYARAHNVAISKIKHHLTKRYIELASAGYLDVHLTVAGSMVTIVVSALPSVPTRGKDLSGEMVTRTISFSFLPPVDDEEDDDGDY